MDSDKTGCMYVSGFKPGSLDSGGSTGLLRAAMGEVGENWGQGSRSHPSSLGTAPSLSVLNTGLHCMFLFEKRVLCLKGI